MEMKTHKIRDTIFLFLTAMIWGAAFVAQSVSMDYIGPFTFICLRSVIGGLFLIPVIMVIDNIRKKRRSESVKTASDNGINSFQKMQAEEEKLSWKNKRLLESGIVCGIFLFLANCFQQTGIQYTTVGKAGFITTLYIIIVPFMGLFLKRKIGINIWISAVIAAVGMYFLCITESFSIGAGDRLVLMCSVVFSVHILVIDHFSPKADGVVISCVQFFTAGVIASVLMLLFEHPSVSAVIAAAAPILYAGVMSCGVGYTLQVVAQNGVDPTVASLLLSLESVFSVLAGWMLLGQKLSGRELFGCVLVFAAVLLVQIPTEKLFHTA